MVQATEVTAQQIRDMQSLGQHKPDEWCQASFGVDLWGIQAEILRSVFDYLRTTVRSCSGSGKSFDAACAALCFLYNFPPATVLTTAPTFRQVESILWREIAGLHGRAPMLGGRLTATKLDLTPDWFALGLSTDQPERFQGFHNVNVLVVGDEASGLPPSVYSAIENPLATGNAHLLLIGNPTQPAGDFRNTFQSAAYNKFHISAFDTPNFTEFGITLEDIRKRVWQQKIAENRLPRPYLITPQWVAERWEEWGEDSYQWQVYVMGNFPEGGIDSVFRLESVEKAMNRCIEPVGDKVCALDVSRYGDCETAFATRIGEKVLDFVVWSHQDTIYTAGRTMRQIRLNQPTITHIDSVGVGGGVVDDLKTADEAPNIHEFNAGAAAVDKEIYGNRRAELFFYLKRKMENDEIQLPNDDRLKAELCDMRYYFNRKGQIFIESKEEARARGAKSPDRADALMMLFSSQIGRKQGGKPNVKYYF